MSGRKWHAKAIVTDTSQLHSQLQFNSSGFSSTKRNLIIILRRSTPFIIPLISLILSYSQFSDTGFYS